MEGYLTVKETAEKWDLTVRRVQIMCSKGMIPGVSRFGSVWVIPADAERPADRRVKSGKYRDWRKKKTEE